MAPRFKRLCVEFAVLALTTSGVCEETEARQRIETAIESGAAHERALLWFEAQGATGMRREQTRNLVPGQPPRSFLVDPDMSGGETFGAFVEVPRHGWVAHIDPAKVADAVLELGGGRRTKGDRIDHGVGVRFFNGVGDQIDHGDGIRGVFWIGQVSARSEEAARTAAKAIAAAVEISDVPVEPRPLFLD